jgi:hypothetical protein
MPGRRVVVLASTLSLLVLSACEGKEPPVKEDKKDEKVLQKKADAK